MPFTEIDEPSPSGEQVKAISEHSIPLGKHKKFYFLQLCVVSVSHDHSHDVQYSHLYWQQISCEIV